MHDLRTTSGLNRDHCPTRRGLTKDNVNSPGSAHRSEVLATLESSRKIELCSLILSPPVRAQYFQGDQKPEERLLFVGRGADHQGSPLVPPEAAQLLGFEVEYAS